MPLARGFRAVHSPNIPACTTFIEIYDHNSGLFGTCTYLGACTYQTYQNRPVNTSSKWHVYSLFITGMYMRGYNYVLHVTIAGSGTSRCFHHAQEILYVNTKLG